MDLIFIKLKIVNLIEKILESPVLSFSRNSLSNLNRACQRMANLTKKVKVLGKIITSIATPYKTVKEFVIANPR